MNAPFKRDDITPQQELQRNLMLDIGAVPGKYDIDYFHDVKPHTMRKLMEAGLADPEDNQNGAPTLLEMTEYCESMGGRATMHGYVIPSNRDDCRVTAEGVGVSGPLSAEEMSEFVRLFRHADTFQVSPTGAYCWYD